MAVKGVEVVSNEMKLAQAALGFRVKSGWATAVLVTGSIESILVLDRRTIELCDPGIPESRQPYHAGMGTLQLDDEKVERLRKVVARAANRSVTKLIRDFRGAMVGRADKGLLMTTGSFTRDAQKEATRDGAPPIDLVDGEQLTDLLRNLKLGIRTQRVERLIVEPEWFKAI